MIPRPWVAFMPLLAMSASAERLLRATSLDTCQEGSGLYASMFDIVYRPDLERNNLAVKVDAISAINGNVTLDITLNVYGYEALRQEVDPCSFDLDFGCPLLPNRIPVPQSNVDVGPEVANAVPGIGYNFPDLDASIRILVNRTDNGETVACLETRFSNDKTVNLAGIKWATALVTLLGLVTSAIMSGLGHTNTAAHLAASTLSLFSYFQAQAMVNLSGVRLPPAATAWTQNFVWSLGLIKARWMQNIFTWFQRATGGEAAVLLDSVRHASVHVMKRDLDPVSGVTTIAKRANIQLDSGGYVVYGIQRVAFQAKMESTNVFLTCLVFFCLLVLFSALFVVIAQLIVALAAKKNWIAEDRFMELRSGDRQVLLKGVLLRMTLLGFPALAIFCLWEFTQVDSPALVVLAVLFFFGMLGTLSWAAFRIITMGRHSTTVYQTPSYLLFSNPYLLQKLGFLYVPFRATAYYYIAPHLVYIVVKAAIIAFGQHNGAAQAICLIIVEAAFLGGASVLRPWMDRSTNILNIAICVVNFLNAIFLFLLANVFNAPGLLVGISGILIFLVNAIFSLVLLLLVIISSVVVFWRKNPDTRYRAMDDDRVSFWKSKTQLNTTQELDELAATARGGKENMYHNDSRSSDSPEPERSNRFTMQSISSASRSQLALNQRENASAIWSPVDPSTPLNRAGEHEQGMGGNRPVSPYQDSHSIRSGRGPAREPTLPGFVQQDDHSAPQRGPWKPGNGY
ncbi:hypothetical protein F5X68DRAFT_212605 [Plectosphaerella plurivora]|uniref:ML-like domain-containing protein n=1 Tax=Plectosphaerella plurivora TaxID=936078 RepID=A0A9P8V8C4_9PEZI|nr:hypothetical protein F5X68DRAFT_212605 [Plectosphaerella plurivora]